MTAKSPAMRFQWFPTGRQEQDERTQNDLGLSHAMEGQASVGTPAGKLRIAIDPELLETYGPEVRWSWRLVLASLGYAWQEVPFDHPAGSDIAYLGPGRKPHPEAHVCIRANLDRWRNRRELRLESVRASDGWSVPSYQGETASDLSFQSHERNWTATRDIVFDLFWSVTGQEERHWPKNAHGHLDLASTAHARCEVYRQPIASGLIEGIGAVIREFATAADPVSRWPSGKIAAACASHDVDYPEVVRWLEPLRILRKRGLSGSSAAISVLTGAKTHWHFDSWMSREKALGTRSAFYFVPSQGSLFQYVRGTPDPFYDVRSPKFRDVFKRLRESGFEIGIQASYRAFESEEKFASEKLRLEEACGQAILGCRHHYWHLNPADPEETLRIHEKVGLHYDASLNHERYLGWRRGIGWPFFPFDQHERRELRTLQIPTVWMDDHLFGHKKHNPGEPASLLAGVAQQTARLGGCLMIDVHEYVYDPELFPGWSETYLRFWETLAERTDYWIRTPAEIAEHCRRRYEALVRQSSGL